MERDDVRARLERARRKLEENDAHLLANDLSERCIAARLALYLQPEFPDHHVDVEYNRFGNRVKRLQLPQHASADAIEMPIPQLSQTLSSIDAAWMDRTSSSSS